MTTGDLKNNLRKLSSAIKGVEYPGDPDIDGLSQGKSEAFLPIYHYAFLEFSCPLAELISAENIELSGKTDVRFIEGMYKTLREIFAYKPPLTQTQFLSRTYVEKKIIMGTEILERIRAKHRHIRPKPKARAPNTSNSRPASAPVRKFEDLSPTARTSKLSPIMGVVREKKVTFREGNYDRVETVFGDSAMKDSRPFDHFALTPSNHPMTSSPLASEKLDDLLMKVSTVEEALQQVIHRLEALEEKLHVPESAPPPSATLLETLAARLTLVENKMEIGDAQKEIGDGQKEIGDGQNQDIGDGQKQEIGDGQKQEIGDGQKQEIGDGQKEKMDIRDGQKEEWSMLSGDHFSPEAAEATEIDLPLE